MIKSIKDRLLANRKIDPATNCWIWTGSRFTNGYGSIKHGGKSTGVHRLSLIVFNGITYKVGEQANHIKECKNKSCFNPEHLYVGTHQNNMDDISSKCSGCGKDKIKGERCKDCRKKHNKAYYNRRASGGTGNTLGT